MSIDLAFSFLSALGVLDDPRTTTDGSVMPVSAVRFQLESLGGKHPGVRVSMVKSRMRVEVWKRVSN